jgi:hypothetical protein
VHGQHPHRELGTLTYTAAVPGYTLTAVTITNNTPAATNNWTACKGLAYRVTLEGATNNQLVETTGTVPTLGAAKGSWFTTTAFAPESAALVTGVAVVIGG